MKEKILIAISDTNLTNILIKDLQGFGYIVESEQNGAKVIEKMKNFKPELLLIGITLEGKDGYEILTEKSFDKDVTKIPVIILSNNGSPIQMNKIPSTPMVKDYIIRFHIESNEVIEKIEKVFGRTLAADEKKTNLLNKKVLWVEDDKLLSNILSKKIIQSGFTLLKASNADSAFKFLESDLPDLIMLDILLPEMTGLEILQKIKTIDKLRSIPTIMLSNLSKQSDIDKAKALGANKFIVKATSSLDDIITEMTSLTTNK